MQDLIKEFMAQRIFAVVGATDNPEKYGHRIFKNLKNRGYEVYPVNPKLKECKELGLSRIWLQPGSESEAAIAFCRKNSLKVVHDVCVILN